MNRIELYGGPCDGMQVERPPGQAPPQVRVPLPKGEAIYTLRPGRWQADFDRCEKFA